jgi:hypothetical protein
MSDTDQTVKAKKARKPFVWTPKRKETFDKMRKIREEKINNKVKEKANLKEAITSERKQIDRVIKLKNELARILGSFNEIPSSDIVNEPIAKQIEVEKPIEIVKKVIVQPKAPEPEPITQESEEEEEEEEEAPPVYVPPPKPRNVNTFRYNTQTHGYGVPREPITKPKPSLAPYVKPKPSLVFL